MRLVAFCRNSAKLAIVKQEYSNPFVRVVLCCGALLIMGSSAFGQNLVVNGSFVDYTTSGGGNPNVAFAGWAFAGPYRGVAVGTSAVGSNSAYFGSGYDDNGTTGDTLSQTVSISDPNQTYYLNFYVSGEGGSGASLSDSSSFYVVINGARVLDFVNESFGSAWVPQRFAFTSVTTTSSILFGGYTPGSFMVSNVSIVPEPATLYLAASGLIAFLGTPHLQNRRRENS